MTFLILLIPSILESTVHVRIVENMVITSEIVLEQVVTLQHLRVRPLLSRKLDIKIVVPKKLRMKTVYSLHFMMIPTNLMMMMRKCLETSSWYWRN